MRDIHQQSFSEVGLDLMAQAVKRQYSGNSQFDLAVLLLLGGGVWKAAQAYIYFLFISLIPPRADAEVKPCLSPALLLRGVLCPGELAHCGAALNFSQLCFANSPERPHLFLQMEQLQLKANTWPAAALPRAAGGD